MVWLDPSAGHVSAPADAAPADAAPAERFAGDQWQLLTDVIETQNAIAAAEMVPETVMRIIADRTQALTAADGALIELVDGERLLCRAATGIALPAVGLCCCLENTSSGAAIRSGVPQCIADVCAAENVMHDRCQKLGIRSMLTVPLSYQDRVVGVLKVVSARVEAFSRQHVTSLQLMAGMLAAALAQAAEFESKKKALAERTLAISVLREAEERFHAAFDRAAIGMSIQSPQGAYTQVNDALCVMLGYTAAELLQRDFYSVTHPDDLESSQNAVKLMLSGEASTHRVLKRYLHKDGHVVWANSCVALVRDDRNEPLYFISQVEDITQRKQAEDALRASEAEFRAMFDLAGVGKALTDLCTGRFIRVNSRLCQITGYSADQLRDMTFQNLSHPDDAQSMRDLMESLEAGDINDSTVERRLLHRGSQEIWASINVASVRDSTGKPARAVATVQDVTERKKSEWLEIDRRRVLEMVAKDMPLPDVLGQLSQAIERQIGGWAAVMALQNGGICIHGPSLPGELRTALHQRCLALAARLSTGVWIADDMCGVTYFAEDDLWQDVRPVAARYGLQACWAIAIPSHDDASLGLLAFFSEEKRRPNQIEMQTLDLASKLATICVEHHNTTGQLAHLVRHDPLTGLPNRLMFEDRLQLALAMAKRSGRMTALMFLDIDKFKSINDTLGHQAGDHVLQQFALRLRCRLRETDTMARLGGDEFAVVLPEIDSADQAERVARKLIDSLAEPFQVMNRSCFATTSIGIALYPPDAQDGPVLERMADEALYKVKQTGRNGFAFSATRAARV